LLLLLLLFVLFQKKSKEALFKVFFFCIWKHILAWKKDSSSTDLFTYHMYTLNPKPFLHLNQMPSGALHFRRLAPTDLV
jgi:hypothetical protein